ncbi:MAG: tyrosine-type recombinase/integrase, partial [Leptospira sp.]|nr:tyrosine-type recombinase/integrase [Leptospira sp.]
DTEEKMKLIPKPRRSYRVPVVLNQEEVNDLLFSCDGVFEKLFLSLLYSTGIRISELTNLKIQDIDIERKTIYISKTKSRTQRYVILSENVIDILNYYILVYKPKEYLFFKSKSKSSALDLRPLQIIFQRIVKRSKIKKRATSHTLRHSFATHLLESGCNILYIQRLLGHKSLSSTLLYLHLDNSIHLKIRSPFESVNSEVLNPNQFMQQPSLDLKCA